MTSKPENHKTRISDVVVDRAARRVTRSGEDLSIGGLTYDMLVALIDASPGMIDYDELTEQVWGGRSTAPETIAQRAKMLRQALDDDAKSPRYFELVRGKGYRLIPDVIDDAPSLDRVTTPPPSRFRPLYATVIALIAVGIALYFWRTPDQPRSLAVLPFTDLSETRDQQVFAEGISEELIASLATLSGLEVSARSRSFQASSPPASPADIGRELNVDAILQGSVRKNDTLLRITVQLIDVASGYHLWGASFDRDAAEILEIQREIATSVAGALGVRFNLGDSNAFAGAGTQSIDAYEAYLRGEFQNAIDIDPNYASAWAQAGLRIASTMWNNQPEQAPAIIEAAMTHVSRAIELDPESARANSDFATLAYVVHDWSGAEAVYRHSLRLRWDTSNLANYGNMLMRAGRSRHALSYYDEWRKLAPTPVAAGLWLRANALMASNNPDFVREQMVNSPKGLQKILTFRLALNFGESDDVLAALREMPAAYQPLVDAWDSPTRVVQLLREMSKDDSVLWPSKYEEIALVAAYLNEPELAFDIFYRELQHTTIRFGSLWLPVMAEVRRLPAFHQFVESVNLVDYWREHGWSDFCKPVNAERISCI